MNREKLSELLTKTEGWPGVIEQAARAENSARMARDNAKEDYELAVVNAVLSANGQLDGKNAEERKMKSDAFLAGHKEVRAARQRLSAAESVLLDAQLETRHAEDVFAALRAELRALGSYLEYLAGERRQTRN